MLWFRGLRVRWFGFVLLPLLLEPPPLVPSAPPPVATSDTVDAVGLQQPPPQQAQPQPLAPTSPNEASANSYADSQNLYERFRGRYYVEVDVAGEGNPSFDAQVQAAPDPNVKTDSLQWSCDSRDKNLDPRIGLALANRGEVRGERSAPVSGSAGEVLGQKNAGRGAAAGSQVTPNQGPESAGPDGALAESRAAVELGCALYTFAFQEERGDSPLPPGGSVPPRTAAGGRARAVLQTVRLVVFRLAGALGGRQDETAGTMRREQQITWVCRSSTLLRPASQNYKPDEDAGFGASGELSPPPTGAGGVLPTASTDCGDVKSMTWHSQSRRKENMLPFTGLHVPQPAVGQPGASQGRRRKNAPAKTILHAFVRLQEGAADGAGSGGGGSGGGGSSFPDYMSMPGGCAGGDAWRELAVAGGKRKLVPGENCEAACNQEPACAAFEVAQVAGGHENGGACVLFTGSVTHAGDDELATAPPKQTAVSCNFRRDLPSETNYWLGHRAFALYYSAAFEVLYVWLSPALRRQYGQLGDFGRWYPLWKLQSTGQQNFDDLDGLAGSDDEITWVTKSGRAFRLEWSEDLVRDLLGESTVVEMISGGAVGSAGSAGANAKSSASCSETFFVRYCVTKEGGAATTAASTAAPTDAPAASGTAATAPGGAASPMAGDEFSSCCATLAKSFVERSKLLDLGSGGSCKGEEQKQNQKQPEQEQEGGDLPCRLFFSALADPRTIEIRNRLQKGVPLRLSHALWATAIDDALLLIRLYQQFSAFYPPAAPAVSTVFGGQSGLGGSVDISVLASQMQHEQPEWSSLLQLLSPPASTATPAGTTGPKRRSLFLANGRGVLEHGFVAFAHKTLLEMKTFADTRLDRKTEGAFLADKLHTLLAQLLRAYLVVMTLRQPWRLPESTRKWIQPDNGDLSFLRCVGERLDDDDKENPKKTKFTSAVDRQVTGMYVRLAARPVGDRDKRIEPEDAHVTVPMDARRGAPGAAAAQSAGPDANRGGTTVGTPAAAGAAASPTQTLGPNSTPQPPRNIADGAGDPNTGSAFGTEKRRIFEKLFRHVTSLDDRAGNAQEAFYKLDDLFRVEIDLHSRGVIDSEPTAETNVGCDGSGGCEGTSTAAARLHSEAASGSGQKSSFLQEKEHMTEQKKSAAGGKLPSSKTAKPGELPRPRTKEKALRLPRVLFTPQRRWEVQLADRIFRSQPHLRAKDDVEDVVGWFDSQHGYEYDVLDEVPISVMTSTEETATFDFTASSNRMPGDGRSTVVPAAGGSPAAGSAAPAPMPPGSGMPAPSSFSETATAEVIDIQTTPAAPAPAEHNWRSIHAIADEDGADTGPGRQKSFLYCYRFTPGGEPEDSPADTELKVARSYRADLMVQLRQVMQHGLWHLSQAVRSVTADGTQGDDRVQVMVNAAAAEEAAQIDQASSSSFFQERGGAPDGSSGLQMTEGGASTTSSSTVDLVQEPGQLAGTAPMKADTASGAAAQQFPPESSGQQDVAKQEERHAAYVAPLTDSARGGTEPAQSSLTVQTVIDVTTFQGNQEVDSATRANFDALLGSDYARELFLYPPTTGTGDGLPPREKTRQYLLFMDCMLRELPSCPFDLDKDVPFSSFLGPCGESPAGAPSGGSAGGTRDRDLGPRLVEAKLARRGQIVMSTLDPNSEGTTKEAVQKWHWLETEAFRRVRYVFLDPHQARRRFEALFEAEWRALGDGLALTSSVPPRCSVEPDSLKAAVVGSARSGEEQKEAKVEEDKNVEKKTTFSLRMLVNFRVCPRSLAADPMRRRWLRGTTPTTQLTNAVLVFDQTTTKNKGTSKATARGVHLVPLHFQLFEVHDVKDRLLERLQLSDPLGTGSGTATAGKSRYALTTQDILDVAREIASLNICAEVLERAGIADQLLLKLARELFPAEEQQLLESPMETDLIIITSEMGGPGSGASATASSSSPASTAETSTTNAAGERQPLRLRAICAESLGVAAGTSSGMQQDEAHTHWELSFRNSAADKQAFCEMLVREMASLLAGSAGGEAEQVGAGAARSFVVRDPTGENENQGGFYYSPGFPKIANAVVAVVTAQQGANAENEKVEEDLTLLLELQTHFRSLVIALPATIPCLVPSRNILSQRVWSGGSRTADATGSGIGSRTTSSDAPRISAGFVDDEDPDTGVPPTIDGRKGAEDTAVSASAGASPGTFTIPAPRELDQQIAISPYATEIAIASGCDTPMPRVEIFSIAGPCGFRSLGLFLSSNCRVPQAVLPTGCVKSLHWEKCGMILEEASGAVVRVPRSVLAGTEAGSVGNRVVEFAGEKTIPKNGEIVPAGVVGGVFLPSSSAFAPLSCARNGHGLCLAVPNSAQRLRTAAGVSIRQFFTAVRDLQTGFPSWGTLRVSAQSNDWSPLTCNVEKRFYCSDYDSTMYASSATVENSHGRGAAIHSFMAAVCRSEAGKKPVPRRGVGHDPIRGTYVWRGVRGAEMSRAQQLQPANPATKSTLDVVWPAFSLAAACEMSEREAGLFTESAAAVSEIVPEQTNGVQTKRDAVFSERPPHQCWGLLGVPPLYRTAVAQKDVFGARTTASGANPGSEAEHFADRDREEEAEEGSIGRLPVVPGDVLEVECFVKDCEECLSAKKQVKIPELRFDHVDGSDQEARVGGMTSRGSGEALGFLWRYRPRRTMQVGRKMGVDFRLAGRVRWGEADSASAGELCMEAENAAAQSDGTSGKGAEKGRPEAEQPPPQEDLDQSSFLEENGAKKSVPDAPTNPVQTLENSARGQTSSTPAGMHFRVRCAVYDTIDAGLTRPDISSRLLSARIETCPGDPVTREGLLAGGGAEGQSNAALRALLLGNQQHSQDGTSSPADGNTNNGAPTAAGSTTNGAPQEGASRNNDLLAGQSLENTAALRNVGVGTLCEELRKAIEAGEPSIDTTLFQQCYGGNNALREAEDAAGMPPLGVLKWSAAEAELADGSSSMRVLGRRSADIGEELVSIPSNSRDGQNSAQKRGEPSYASTSFRAEWGAHSELDPFWTVGNSYTIECVAGVLLRQNPFWTRGAKGGRDVLPSFYHATLIDGHSGTKVKRRSEESYMFVPYQKVSRTFVLPSPTFVAEEPVFVIDPRASERETGGAKVALLHARSEFVSLEDGGEGAAARGGEKSNQEDRRAEQGGEGEEKKTGVARSGKEFLNTRSGGTCEITAIADTHWLRTLLLIDDPKPETYKNVVVRHAAAFRVENGVSYKAACTAIAPDGQEGEAAETTVSLPLDVGACWCAGGGWTAFLAFLASFAFFTLRHEKVIGWLIDAGGEGLLYAISVPFFLLYFFFVGVAVTVLAAGCTGLFFLLVLTLLASGSVLVFLTIPQLCVLVLVDPARKELDRLREAIVDETNSQEALAELHESLAQRYFRLCSMKEFRVDSTAAAEAPQSVAEGFSQSQPQPPPPQATPATLLSYEQMDTAYGLVDDLSRGFALLKSAARLENRRLGKLSDVTQGAYSRLPGWQDLVAVPNFFVGEEAHAQEAGAVWWRMDAEWIRDFHSLTNGAETDFPSRLAWYQQQAAWSRAAFFQNLQAAVEEFARASCCADLRMSAEACRTGWNDRLGGNKTDETEGENEEGGATIDIDEEGNVVPAAGSGAALEKPPFDASCKWTGTGAGLSARTKRQLVENGASRGESCLWTQTAALILGCVQDSGMAERRVQEIQESNDDSKFKDRYWCPERYLNDYLHARVVFASPAALVGFFWFLVGVKCAQEEWNWELLRVENNVEKRRVEGAEDVAAAADTTENGRVVKLNVRVPVPPFPLGDVSHVAEVDLELENFALCGDLQKKLGEIERAQKLSNILGPIFNTSEQG